VKRCQCRALHQSPGDYSACAMKRRRAVMMGCADTIHAPRRCLDAACSRGRAWKGEAPHSGAAAALASAPRPTSPATRALRPDRANAELPCSAHAHAQHARFAIAVCAGGAAAASTPRERCAGRLPSTQQASDAADHKSLPRPLATTSISRCVQRRMQTTPRRCARMARAGKRP